MLNKLVVGTFIGFFIYRLCKCKGWFCFRVQRSPAIIFRNVVHNIVRVLVVAIINFLWHANHHTHPTPTHVHFRFFIVASTVRNVVAHISHRSSTLSIPWRVGGIGVA